MFAAAMGGRSLRWTATKVYGSEITEEEESEEHRRAQRDSHKARRVWHEDNEWDTDDEDDYRYRARASSNHGPQNTCAFF